MGKDFSVMNPKTRRRWHRAADILEIPKEAYHPQAKVVRDSSGNSDYSFGVMFTPHRNKRPIKSPGSNDDCPLCGAVELAIANPDLDIVPEHEIPGMIVTPNKFPFAEGTSIALDTGTGPNERPTYSTKALNGLATELSGMLRLGEYMGLNLYHNTEGSGASIPGHEHWHFLDSGIPYSLVGEVYGLDAAQVESGGFPGVLQAPGFPFAHLIFDESDPERIVHFLKNMGQQIGFHFPKGAVPHSLSQSKHGIAVFPSQRYMRKVPGAGDRAGHFICQSEAEYQEANHAYCMQTLGNALFRKENINLESYL